MRFLRKRTGLRSWVAVIAAYAIVLHAFFGGIVVSQNAAASNFAFVICHGAGGSGDADGDRTPAKHLSCILHCASHAAGTVPQVLPEIAAQFFPGETASLPRAAEIFRSFERTPRLAQAPPLSV